MDNANAMQLQDVVIRFSGDSGDGMQLTGTLFSDTSALLGNGIYIKNDMLACLKLTLHLCL